MTDYLLILHLSDLHFGMNNRFSDLDPNELAKRFTIAINEAKKDLSIDMPIDLVVTTGDIVESGIPKEYIKARDFLIALSNELKINKKYFIFVPGNHDLCWLDSQRAELEQKRDDFNDDELRKRIDKYKFDIFSNLP